MTTVPDPLVGSTVGRYRVARLVGHGGMGAVYEGVQAQSGAAVAIKVLAERYAQDASLIDRFFAEARATTSLAHENIIRVHDLALLPDGRPYIVMELLAGKTLRALIDGGERLPIGGVVNVALEVLSALGAAHAAGVVHRDIKPDNIFITEKGRTKVLDFGIAKLTGANAVARTETGVLLGTPEYMAPEQITEGTVDVRTDIYALGVVLFEALTGRRPFDAKSDFELMRAHVNTAAPSPSTLRADLPPAFDDIARTALAKDPRDRFATTNAMATALHHVATELTLEEWRPLVPGGRLPSPKPPSIPPAVPVPSSDARATVREHRPAKPETPTVADRPRLLRKPHRRRWIVVGGLAAVAAGIVFVITREPTRTRAPIISTPTVEPVRAPEVIAAREPDPPPDVEPARRPANGPRRRTSLDPTHFDWRGYITTAHALARARAPDATWIMMGLDGVMADGHVELTSRGMGVYYSFHTTKLASCEIRIIVTPAGPVVSEIDGRGTICGQRPIGPPRCGLAHVRGAAKLLDTGPAQIVWIDKGWFVSNQTNPRFIPDDCGLPKRDPLDLEPGLAAARTRATNLDEDATLTGITTVVMDEDRIEFTYAFRSSTHCILVARDDASIARDEECPRYPTQLPRCSVARQRTRAKVKSDAKRVKYEYSRDGWDITVRNADSSRTTLHLADDC